MSSTRFTSIDGIGTRIVALVLLVFFSLALLTYQPARSSLFPTALPASQAYIDSLIATPQVSTGCGRTPPQAAGTSSEGSVASDGTLRSYWLHLPLHYQLRHLYPLVLNFHGHGSDPRQQERYTGFSKLADQMSFIVVYPQGAIGAGGATGWDSGGVGRPKTNDVQFVSDLLDKLQRELCIDSRRIYATGFSNGGGMTFVLACRLAERIAAFAPVAGSYFPVMPSCAPGRSVPILEFHGTSDYIVPYTGQPNLHEISVPDWLSFWATEDGCRPNAQTFLPPGSVDGLEWTGCRGGAIVVHYRLDGGTHVWPGGIGGPLRVPTVDQLLDASQLIWRFFLLHPLPPVIFTR
jgi:polyhydroxybutyrate depolymerase